jgi:hypothetical protein
MGFPQLGQSAGEVRLFMDGYIGVLPSAVTSGITRMAGANRQRGRVAAACGLKQSS